MTIVPVIGLLLLIAVVAFGFMAPGQYTVGQDNNYRPNGSNNVLFNVEDMGSLGASAYYNGVTYDDGAGIYGYIHAVTSNCNEAGTVNIQQSWDDSHWVTTKTASYTASTPLTVDDNIRMRYVRYQFKNTGTSSCIMNSTSSLSAY